MRAERDKRAVILHAEGERQSKILTAEGTRQQDILEAQGAQQSAILRADGEAQALERVFQAVHRNDADPKVLAYKYLETIPHLANGENNTFWVIPGEFTEAMRTVTGAFGDHLGTARPSPEAGESAPAAQEEVSTGDEDASLDAVAAAAEMAEEAVSDAKAEVAAAEGSADQTIE